ncbi:MULTISPECIES: hypothetical protein [unclassified Parafrankia]|uniref:hypothetical protein n=1 Tax=unclassified Parafrankia TaxID=2994368 RepID=UPI00103EB80F|nr:MULTISPECIES: hypothetical protein [unclassified Parafrankia]TCJ35033.1 hypothetical protein E0504_30285 [Parafrankia sp. BMG5.11]
MEPVEPSIVWYNSQTGETQIWYMNGHQLLRRGAVLGENGAPAFIGPPFSIVGTSGDTWVGNWKKKAAELIAGHPARLALGVPTSDVNWSKNGYYNRTFEFGEVHVRPLGGMGDWRGIPCTYYAADIFIAAVKCWGTDDPGGADEPYLLFTVINPAPPLCGIPENTAKVWRSQVFEGVERGEIFAQDQLVFENVVVGEHGISLKIAIVDQEHGSPEAVRAELQKQANRLAQSLKDLGDLAGVDVQRAIESRHLRTTYSTPSGI